MSAVFRPHDMPLDVWNHIIRLPFNQQASAVTDWVGKNRVDPQVERAALEQQFSGLLGQYEKAQGASKKANEQRYQQILKGYQQRTNRLMGHARDFGKGETERIQRGLQQDLAGNQQSAISRGLGNTTVLDSMNRGAKLDAGYQQRQLGGQIAGMKAQLDSEASQAQLGFMERRTDTGPDLGQVAQLLSALGQGGYQGRTPKLV